MPFHAGKVRMTDDVKPDTVPTPSPLDEAKRTLALDRQKKIAAASAAIIRLQNEMGFDLVAETISEPFQGGATIVSSLFRIEPRG